jgi:hypothetical protein
MAWPPEGFRDAPILLARHRSDRMSAIWTLLGFLLAAIVGVVGSALWTEYSFQILTIIVFVNAMATITLWQRAARRPEKLKKKFLNRLWESKPITPKHEPPVIENVMWGVGKPRLQFFSDFDDFANVLNEWLASPYAYSAISDAGSPWRLQGLSDTDLHLHGHFDAGPTPGRRYAVFHNQVRLGEFEVEPRRWSEYSTQNPRVRAYVKLNWVRLLHFGRIRSFLTDIALHVTEYQPGTLEYLQTNQEIDRAVMALLWDTQEISMFEFEFDHQPDYGEIKVQLDGMANYYLERRQALLNKPGNEQQQK